MTEKKRGGSGRGQGRKSLSGSGPSPVIRARVSEQQRDTWERVGGAEWLRAELDRLKR